MKKNNKGFTLAELLIVVAIIAVLVAIAIPVFTAQLEKSREATDKANLRSAYAEQMTELLTWDGKSEIKDLSVAAKQTKANWQGDNDAVEITIASGIKDADGNDSGVKVSGTPINGAEWKIKANTDDMKIEITPAA